ncbi:Metallo-beta-lactamase superfamily protein [Seinonella peptonophila]|uniref:Metallo-beta-lactamase superfamily protein n=1 Tax=Seinonella peptonophila TaxID=112248 RepID=A0A1M4WHP8_9BACL|nr:MBL fold metallo-hydrolase [Seinonella peptonophila]SHE80707.1 Metallo-beta-lactamase superfamily protein [Seinonella peptonophila]
MIQVRWHLLHGGSCVQYEKMVFPKERGLRKKIFPSLFSLIEHPTYGPILFDTGYSAHFLQATKQFPNRLYSLVTPVSFSAEQSALVQVERLGFQAKEIGTIILSHLHADHIAGLKDFSNASIWVHRSAWSSIQLKSKLAALRMGFLPDLLPDTIEDRLQLIDATFQIQLPAEYAPFKQGYDLLGDGSLIAVDLPGHAHGQIGLLIQTFDHGMVFLIADCCWDRASYEKILYPHRLTRILHANHTAYINSLHMVNQFAVQHPQAEIVPSHCQSTWMKISAN